MFFVNAVNIRRPTCASRRYIWIEKANRQTPQALADLLFTIHGIFDARSAVWFSRETLLKRADRTETCFGAG